MTTLTMKEEKRLEVIQRVFRGELTVVEAGMVIGVSERHCYRIKARVTKGGAKGVVHGNRGRPCKRKTKEKEVKRVVELAKGKYLGFNDHHLTEKLAEQEKLEISRETVRQILRCAGIASPRKRRGNKHRSRRERRAAEGMMLQVDGSPPPKEFVDEGGLMSYGADYDDLFRKAAHYVDKILKGTKPADLPVQQATKFDFVINLKAAKQMGLTIPGRVLERANQVIK